MRMHLWWAWLSVTLSSTSSQHPFYPSCIRLSTVRRTHLLQRDLLGMGRPEPIWVSPVGHRCGSMQSWLYGILLMEPAHSRTERTLGFIWFRGASAQISVEGCQSLNSKLCDLSHFLIIGLHWNRVLWCLQLESSLVIQSCMWNSIMPGTQ